MSATQVGRFCERLQQKGVNTVNYRMVGTREQLEEVCDKLAAAPWFAFDTEFISGCTYLPRLCLIQVCSPEEEILIDPQTVRDLDPFWALLLKYPPLKIVHGGRMEVEFCYRATGRLPVGWFDVQLAAGFIGGEYPAGYANLLEKYLGLRVAKAETRTDWRRRPLSPAQINYALEDVRYLPQLRDRMAAELKARGRLGWFEEETDRQLGEIRERLTEQSWMRIPGVRQLDRQALGVLRALWHWRESQAQATNRQPEHILRDDLLLALARRKVADPRQIAAVHGFERREYAKLIPSLSLCIKEALALPPEKLPLPLPEITRTPKAEILCQVLFAALSQICRQNQVAVGLMGSPSDVRDWLGYQVYKTVESPPKLAEGWRAELLGPLFEELLCGKKAIVIADPAQELPLEFRSLSPG